MTDQELYEALGIRHFDGGGVINNFGNAPAAPVTSYAPKVELPLPEWTKDIGHGVDPVYAMHKNDDKSFTEYGAPIGYKYDNGNSQYVTTDLQGNVLDVVDRKHGWDSFRDGILKPAAIVTAAAYGVPYLTAPATGGLASGIAGSVFEMTPSIGATMVNAGGTGFLTSAGLQTVINKNVNWGDALKAGLGSATMAGLGEYLKGTDAFKAVPKELQPGTAAATTAAVTGKNPLTAFVGAEVGVAANGIAKQAAESMNLNWNSLPKWARDSMTTAVGSAAKGNTGAGITNDVANVMLNAGLNAAKGFVQDYVSSPSTGLKTTADIPPDLEKYLNKTEYMPVAAE